MEGDASDKNIAFMLLENEADGPYYHQKWQGMPQTTPIVSGGMNAVRLPAFFENLATPMSFLAVPSTTMMDPSWALSLAGRARSLGRSGWKGKLGYIGESSVQSATFDWEKKASAASFLKILYARDGRPLPSVERM